MSSESLPTTTTSNATLQFHKVDAKVLIDDLQQKLGKEVPWIGFRLIGGKIVAELDGDFDPETLKHIASELERANERLTYVGKIS